MAAKKLIKIPSKKPVVKKSTVKAKKATSIKKVAPQKTAVKKKVSGKLIAKAKPIKKSAPVKKVAKPVAKKAAPKKLPTIKKTAVPLKKATTNLNNKSQKPSVKVIPKEVKKYIQKVKEAKPIFKAKDIKVAAPTPIVLPKITSTKARKYEPEFTKSVLDQAAPENNGPLTRYSDAELNEFKELIQRKLETAKKELGYLQGLITRKDEMGGDETDNRYMTMEDGSLSMEREQLSQMASRQITFIDHLEKATMRIENKTYGICRVTGKLIDKARLRAVPHATLSMEAKMGMVK